MKESSDELNPPVVTNGAFISSTRRSRGLKDYLALFLATWGVGYLPLAPGTWGSLVGVGLYLLLRRASVLLYLLFGERRGHVPTLEGFHASLLLLAIFVVSLAGIWAATRAERLMGRKDPGAVVVDEVAGQLMAFLFVPFDAAPWMIFTGFVAFRLFDIWKPYPIRRLEALESGLGIMADDLLAGAYAATLMALVTTLYMFL
ncbi:MAG TPA: phosphatidylglycerophosphatase A [Pyrinomonadaceae bacterium]